MAAPSRRSMSRWLLAAILLGASGFAIAHPAPFSYIDIRLDDSVLSGEVVIHDFDVAHELGIAEAATLLDAVVVRAHGDLLTRLVESRLRLAADGDVLAPRWGEIGVLLERQSIRLPFTVPRRVGGVLQIDAHLFPYDPKHQSFINLYENGALKQQSILDAERRTLKFYRGSLQGRSAVVGAFVKAGVHHILIGIDHVLFLVGLMLLGGSAWRLAAIVTAFTVGHSVTLSLSALDIVRIPSNIIELAIALSIVVVGIDALLVNRQRQNATTPTLRDLRPWLAAVFGLIHGFGFASVLVEFGLPREALGWSLAAFNVGVELGQLAIVLVTLLLGSIATEVLARFVPQRRRSIAERFLTLASCAAIAAGVYWFIERMGLLPQT
jgi:hydrogenase/urease accessory protein HupE